MAQYTYLTNDDIGDKSMEGYDCYDPSGDKVGDVDGIIADDSMTPRYLVVNSGGWFSSKQYVVPIGEVNRVDDGDKHVYFATLTKDMLGSGSYPQYNDEWWNNNDYTSWNAHEGQVARAYAGTAQAGTTARPAAETGRVDYNSNLYTRRPEGTQRIQLMEEQLRANKERFQAGEVKLGKRIVEQPQTVSVPVTEERVVIERTPVTDATPAHSELGKDQTIEVPVMRERVTAEKQPVVREEVGVRKEAVQHTEQVQDTVRREELAVDGDQNLVQQPGREGPLPSGTGRTTAPGATTGFETESPTPRDRAAVTDEKAGFTPTRDNIPPERDARRP